jgi:CBS domain-containing membrane protein
MLVMQLLRCMNPPGAATALAPVITPLNADSFSYFFLLSPVMLNVLLMVIISILLNKLFRIT